MRPEFRYASREDLPAIVATYNSTIASREVTADLSPVSVESRQDWFNKHNPEHRPLWTLFIAGTYAGWMSFSSFYGRPAYDGTVEISIYLEKKFQGNGVGTTCIQYAKQQAVERQITHLLGFIFGHNQPSIRLFEQSGFEKWGHLPGIANMEGIRRDLLIYGLKLI